MNNNHHGGSFHAFMWGAILGAGAVFLLGTKKGKQILKTISEEGVELSDLFDVEEDAEEKCGHCKPAEKKVEPRVEVKEKEPATNGNGSVSKISRRFFRGTSKRS